MFDAFVYTWCNDLEVEKVVETNACTCRRLREREREIEIFKTQENTELCIISSV